MNIITKRRQKLGWSVAELADKADVTRQSVYNWELDRVKPSIDQVIKLADILKISPLSIFKYYINKEE